MTDRKARPNVPERFSTPGRHTPKRRKRTNSRPGQSHQKSRPSDQSRKRRPNTPSGSSRNAHARKRNKSKNGIDPAKFIKKAVVRREENKFVPKHTFTDFGFIEQIEENLHRRGYTQPTPIQDGAIKAVMQGRDLVGLANTGTGKTAAFVLPLVHRLATAQEPERVLVLTPTRELAAQIEDETEAFAKGLPVKSALLIGGVPMHKQRNSLQSWPQMLIATPGRLLDLIGQKYLALDDVSVLVLDEMDRMLDMGFIRDIERILSHLPEKKQTLCFSATVTPDIEEILEKLLHNPFEVSVVQRETAEHVEQDVVVADGRDEKLEVLTKMLREQHYTRVLVFGRTKWGVQKLARKLVQAGITAEAIHGNKTQPQRERALDAFKTGKVSTLVATDVAARGLDIDDVSHVINFDQPATYEDYVHRIGRTGRAGKKGHALTFVTPAEAKRVSR